MMSKEEITEKVNLFLKKLETAEEPTKSDKTKNELVKNIMLLDYFLSEEELIIFLNYLESSDADQKLKYLNTLNDAYNNYNILLHIKKKKIYKKIYRIIAKENKLSSNLKKNKKEFFKYLTLEKYESLQKEILNIDEKIQKNNKFIIYIEKLIKNEKKEKIIKATPKKEKEKLTDYTELLSSQSILAKEFSKFLQEILQDVYIRKYNIALDSSIPKEISDLFEKIQKQSKEEKEELCLLGLDVIKNYLRTISKEEVYKRKFLKKIILLFEKNLNDTYSNFYDTTTYYEILKILSKDDRNYSIIQQIITEIPIFLEARDENTHIVFYLLDEMIYNYKLKLLNHGLVYQNPMFYKEIIKLLLKENHLTEDEQEKYKTILLSFEKYCKNKKYVSMSEVSKTVMELTSLLEKNIYSTKDTSEKLRQEQLCLENSILPNLIQYYQDSNRETITSTENTFTFMIEKIENYAFSVKYNKDGSITLSIHILDNSKLLSLDNNLLNHKEYLLRIDTNHLYPTMNFSYTIYPNNEVSTLNFSFSLLKVEEIIAESNLTNEQKYPFLKDFIKILKKKEKTTNQFIEPNSTNKIQILIKDILSFDIKKILKRADILFIYQEEKINEEKFCQNHNEICQLLSRLPKEEAYQIFDIMRKSKDKYYTVTPTDTSKIILDETTPLGIYLQSIVHKIQEGKYDLSTEIKTISYLLDALNKNEYTPYQVRSENHKKLKKILKPTN